MKILINACYGGWGLSKEAILRFSEKRPELNADQLYFYKMGSHVSINEKGEICISEKPIRTDPDLISVVEELGEKANGAYAEIKIVEIPDKATDWHINKFDGKESIVYSVDGDLLCEVSYE